MTLLCLFMFSITDFFTAYCFIILPSFWFSIIAISPNILFLLFISYCSILVNFFYHFYFGVSVFSLAKLRNRITERCEELRQKNQSQDKMKHSIYETFRLKTKVIINLIQILVNRMLHFILALVFCLNYVSFIFFIYDVTWFLTLIIITYLLK